MKRQLPTTGRGYRWKGAAETPQLPQVRHSKSHKSMLVGMSENRTEGTLYLCVVSGILNSEDTELPANGGLCPCPRSHGEPAGQQVLVFRCSPCHPSHKKVGTKLCLSKSFFTLLHGNQLPIPQPREYELSAAITPATAMVGDAGRSTGSGRRCCSGLELSRSQ